MIHSLFVPGVPRPKGDLRSSIDARGKVRLWSVASVKQWQRDVTLMARSEIGVPIEGPVAIDLAFTFAVAGRVGPHILTPDLDKLVRAILDALTGIAYADDKQVATLVARKRWGTQAGVQIRVGPWDLFGVVTHEEEVPIGV